MMMLSGLMVSVIPRASLIPVFEIAFISDLGL